jgi:hypothetical protein
MWLVVCRMRLHFRAGRRSIAGGADRWPFVLSIASTSNTCARGQEGKKARKHQVNESTALLLLLLPLLPCAGGWARIQNSDTAVLE